MREKTDRRVRKTRRELKMGLASLMKEKSIGEITVKELVDQVDINRSTFYLHYSDIWDLLREMEDDMAAEMEQAVRAHPIDDGESSTFLFIQDMFRVLDQNREIGCALIGPNGDVGFLRRIEGLLEEYSSDLLEELFSGKVEEIRYFYSFCLNGCLGFVKTWLEEGENMSPEDAAQLTFQMVVHSMRGIL